MKKICIAAIVLGVMVTAIAIALDFYVSVSFTNDPIETSWHSGQGNYQGYTPYHLGNLTEDHEYTLEVFCNDGTIEWWNIDGAGHNTPKTFTAGSDKRDGYLVVACYAAYVGYGNGFFQVWEGSTLVGESVFHCTPAE